LSQRSASDLLGLSARIRATLRNALGPLTKYHSPYFYAS
jgi:hypothetical protein